MLVSTPHPGYPHDLSDDQLTAAVAQYSCALFEESEVVHPKGRTRLSEG